jgi:hypothetical protein
MSPHNLVRHALGGGSIGVSKAEALKADLLNLYPGQRDLLIESKHASVIEVLRETGVGDESGYRNLLDMTASNVVFNAICDADLPDSLKDVEAILDAHYLGRDVQLAEAAVLKLEKRTKL